MVYQSTSPSPFIRLFLTIATILGLRNMHLQYRYPTSIRSSGSFMMSLPCGCGVHTVKWYPDVALPGPTTARGHWNLVHAVIPVIECQEKIGYCQSAKMALLVPEDVYDTTLHIDRVLIQV
ncbi:hypothetical protein AG1IA_07527 [Rhizoctonia solani AG-1 IA]|uniref:Uncharacterized protein n=1 Tax=Thanatephorus cucumeris (strain AG1-IA) TaxID=983506 RepID=L8WQ32_THACA|nr:hypothetical protein AG1IA_07527 [Rhizoctonia solani AG-1 IA]